MTDPKATPRIADSTCCCCNEDCHAKRIAAEAKIAELQERCDAAIASWDEERERANREGVLVADLQSRLAAFENVEGMPEEPRPHQGSDWLDEYHAYVDKLRAFAAKQAVDAGRYQWLRNKSANQYQHPIVVSQQIVSQKKHDFAMQYRGPLVFGELDAAIDAAKGK